MTERIVAIKITSDGRAFVADLGANTQASAVFSKAVDDAGKQADAAGEKITRAGKKAKEAAEGVKKVGDDAKGAGEGLTKLGAGAGAAEPKVKAVGDQAQRTAQQLRQVAPQVTDIVTQLASGASPLQVFIQQGGQLKDVFGGAAPAARALGGYIVGMITPTTVLGAAAVALAAGFVKGRDEGDALARQIILSGNAAGVTASQYYEMAGAIAAVGGSKGQALETLQQMAQQGRVGAENLQRYGQIAQELDRLVGKPVADTVKEFAALAESPVQASLKLTQTYNHLTESVYRQIKALQDAGQHTEAAKLAQKAFADAMDERIPKMREHLGYLQSGWLEVRDAIKKAGDALLNIGRAPTLQDQIALVRQQIEQAQGKDPNRRHALPWDPKLPELQAQLAVLEQQALSERKIAFAAAERLATTQASARFDKLSEESLSKQEQLARRIREIEAEGAAGQRSAAEIQAAIEAAKKKFVDTDAEAAHQGALDARLARIRRAGEAEAIATKETVDRVKAMRQAGAISEAEAIDQIGEAEVALMERQREHLREQLDIVAKKKNSQREVADLEGQILKQDVLIDARRRKIDEDQLARREKLAKRTREIYQHQAGEWSAQMKAEEVAATKRFDAAQESVTSYVRALRDENETLEFQTSLLGKNSIEQARLIELRRIAINLKQKEDEIDARAAGGNLTGKQVDSLKAEAKLAAAEAAAKAETKVWLAEWQRTYNTLGGALYDILTGRGRDASRKLQDIFENMVLRPRIEAFFQPLTTWGTNSIMGMAGAPPSVTGGANALNSAMNIGSMGSSIAGMFGSGGLGASLLGGGSAAATLFGTGGGASAIATSAGALEAGVLVEGIGGTAGALSGFGSALAAIPGWGWAAMAALAILGMSKRKGGDKQDGVFGMIGSGIGMGNRSGDLSSAAQLSALGIQGQFDQLTRGLGVTNSGVRFGVGISTDPKGDSPSFLDITASRGNQTLFTSLDRNVGRSQEELQKALAAGSSRAILGALQGMSGLSAGAMYEMRTSTRTREQREGSSEGGDLVTYVETVTEQVLSGAFDAAARAAAESASGVPKTIRDMLRGQDLNAISPEAADALMASVTTIVNGVTQFRAAAELWPVDKLAGLGFDTSAALIKFSGTVEQLLGNVSSYVENFYSEEEKRAQTIQNITKVLTTAGLDVTERQVANGTRAQFRAIAEAQDLTTEAGQRNYAALMQVAGAFATLTAESGNLAGTLTANLDEATQAIIAARRAESEALRENINNLTSAASRYRSFATDLRRFRDTLLLGDLSPLTPQQQYEQARRIAEETYARALTGDATAMGQIESVAQDFLRASQVYNASGAAYLADFATVQSYLAVGASKADEAAAWAEAQAAIGQAQLSALDTINTSVLTVAQAVQNLYSAGAAVVNSGGRVGDAPLREYLGTMHAAGRGAEALDALRAAGRTMADGDRLMGWQSGTIEGWARAAGVPVFHDGTPSVPHTGLAVVKQGERILSTGSNDALVRELAALRAEVAALRVEHRQGVGSRNAATLAAADKIVEGVAEGAGRNAWARRNEQDARATA